MTMMTYEQAQKRLALEAENRADRDLLYGATSLSESERIAIGAKMVERTGQIMAIRAAADPTPSLFAPGKLDIDPGVAALRAEEIRKRPEYFNPNKKGENGLPLLTPEQHAALVQEVLSLDARASEG